MGTNLKSNSQKEKHFVVDTSALIEFPDIINRIPGSVCVPLTVIKQLDGLKNSSDPGKCKKARFLSSAIEDGIKSKKISLLTSYDKIDGLTSDSDNKIVGAAVRLMKDNPDVGVCLVTTDRNMRITASAYGIIVPGLDCLKRASKPKVPLYCYAMIVIGVVLICYPPLYFEPVARHQGDTDWEEIIILWGLLMFFGGIFLGLLKGSSKSAPYNKAWNNHDDHDAVGKNLALGINDPGDWILY